MILVALGTHEQPFERALDLVAELAPAERLVVQHGHTPSRRELDARWVGFVSYDDMLGLLQEAEVVVCHAGVGTILSALASAKRPIVIPRLRRHGEHVDDHQLQITASFESRRLVHACREGHSLRALVDRVRSEPPPQLTSRGGLVTAIVDAVDRDSRTARLPRPRLRRRPRPT